VRADADGCGHEQGDEQMREQGATVMRNPVLTGWHPDPSILRMGSDFYLATSTVERYPGVRLHHSTDLAHRRPLTGALAGTPPVGAGSVRPDRPMKGPDDVEHA
jgi:hypothetical protein